MGYKKTRWMFVLLIAELLVLILALAAPARAVYRSEPWEETVPAFIPVETATESKVHELRATITAYCPCAKCCGKWAYNRPDGIVYTSSGAAAKEGVTVAVDPNVIPIGALVTIDGHEYIAQDTGVKGAWIDIYCASHRAALGVGMQAKVISWRIA